MQIHVARDGKQLGPFTLEEINRQLAAGTLSLSDNAWYEGAAGWAPLSTVPGVGTTAAAAPSATPAASAASGPVVPAGSTPTAKTEPLAIMSLIFSVLGLSGFCCGLLLLLAVAGVVCGHLAMSKIKSTPGLEGHGLALSGVIVGYVAIASWVLWLLFFGGLAALGAFMDATKN
jgi:uncharacterized protein DUF4190/uncharacterized protein DUF4339